MWLYDSIWIKVHLTFFLYIYNYKYVFKSNSRTKVWKSQSPRFGTRGILLLETISSVLVRLSAFFRNSYHEVNLNDICGPVMIPSFLLAGRNICSKCSIFICPFRKLKHRTLPFIWLDTVKGHSWNSVHKNLPATSPQISLNTFLYKKCAA